MSVRLYACKNSKTDQHIFRQFYTETVTTFQFWVKSDPLVGTQYQPSPYACPCEYTHHTYSQIQGNCWLGLDCIKQWFFSGQCSTKTRRRIFGLHCHYTNVWFFCIPATVNRRWIVGPFLIRVCSKQTVWLVGMRTGNAPLIYWNLSVLRVHYAVYKRRHATQPWSFDYVSQLVYFHKWQCPTTQGNIAECVLKHAQRDTRVCASPFLMREVWHCSWERGKKKPPPTPYVNIPTR
jgi:hypothetical protein